MPDNNLETQTGVPHEEQTEAAQTFLGQQALADHVETSVGDVRRATMAEETAGPERTYWDPPEDARQAIDGLLGGQSEFYSVSWPEDKPKLSVDDALSLIDNGYAELYLRQRACFEPIDGAQALADRILAVEQFKLPATVDDNGTPSVNPLASWDGYKNWTVAKSEEEAVTLVADDTSRKADSGNAPILNNETAERLIQGGKASMVIEHPEVFPGLKLDARLAHDIIATDRRGARAVAWNLEKFEGLQPNRELADELIRAGAASEVLQDADEFSGFAIDAAFVDAVMDGKQAEELFRLSVARKITFDDALFRRFVETGQGNKLVIGGGVYDEYSSPELRKNFVELQGETAEFVIEHCKPFNDHPNEYGEPSDDRALVWEVLRDAQRFRGFTPNAEVAETLTEKGYNRSVIVAADRIEGLTAEHAAALIADEDTQPEVIISLIEKVSYFHGFKPGSELAERVQEAFALRGNEEGHVGAGMLAHAIRNFEYAWYADHAYQDLGDGWDKATIGQIISLRLEQVEGEDDLHDASQWLSEFSVPPTGYDVNKIEALRASGITGQEALDAARVTYIDQSLQEELLRTLLESPLELRERLNLPAKDQKVDAMFTNGANKLIYRALLENLHSPHLSFETLSVSVHAMSEQFYAQEVEGKARSKDEQGHGSFAEFQSDFEVSLEFLEHPLDTSRPATEDAGWGSPTQAAEYKPRSITGMVAQLQAQGNNRKAYIDDASTWLLRHATTPHTSLTKVWGDRPLAIAEGVQDSTASIARWQKANAFRVTVHEMERKHALPKDITAEELNSGEWQNWREEIMRVQSADNAVQAISNGKRWLAKLGDRPKALPADKRGVEIGGSQYSFEILEARDPRGFTIGEDTGCCMTIKGASRDCIKEGYRNPNAGFMVVYDPNDKVLAQSFTYVNPDQPDTIVLDNIEANQGRDLDKVVDIYKRAWTEYLAQHPDLGIVHVNVGTGYTDVNYAALPKTAPVPPLNDHIYTDDKKQRRLLSVAEAK
jgi:hypothetical protein